MVKQFGVGTLQRKASGPNECVVTKYKSLQSRKIFHIKGMIVAEAVGTNLNALEIRTICNGTDTLLLLLCYALGCEGKRIVPDYQRFKCSHIVDTELSHILK